MMLTDTTLLTQAAQSFRDSFQRGLNGNDDDDTETDDAAGDVANLLFDDLVYLVACKHRSATANDLRTAVQRFIEIYGIPE